MNENLLEELLDVWSKTYYLKPILLIFISISFFVGVKFYTKESSYLNFLIYIIVSLILLILLDIDINKKGVSQRFRTIIIESENTFLEIVEFIAFYHYFFKILVTKTAKALMRIVIIPFIILTIIFYVKIFDFEFSRNQIISLSYKINVIEFFLLFFPCLIFFYELFTIESKQKLTKSPSFWIITGLFFYCTISLPFLLIGDQLAVNNRELFYFMFAVHYASLIFLFFSFTKAFLCKKILIQ